MRYRSILFYIRRPRRTYAPTHPLISLSANSTMNTISSQSLITTTFSPSPTPTARQCTPAHRFRSICRSTPSNDGGSSEQQPPPPAINEDLIRRLREAEEEVRADAVHTHTYKQSIHINVQTTQAQVLKKELAAAKAASATSTPSTQDPLPSAPAFKRIDGGDLRRETLAFVGTFIFLSTASSSSLTHSPTYPPT